jgi:predicted cation transporter
MDEGLHVVNSTDMMMISKLNVLFMMLIDMLTWYIDRPTTIFSLPSDTSHVGSRPVGVDQYRRILKHVFLNY